MKREDLEKIDGLSKEAIDKIMAMNGQDIEKHKTAAETAKSETDGLKKQLEDANKQIESFKGMDIDGVKKAADEYKAKFEQAQTDAAKQIADLKFQHALDGALTGAKAKNPKAVKALLDMEALQKAFDDKTGTFIGFDEHLKPIKEANDYLFEGDKPDPKIVLGGNNQTITTDAFEAAMRKGAGLSEKGT
ncbi:MAG TPA: phage scaffolding protein [Anaerolineaceae bacterium]|nr:phage scaffolding protein [Anaerolineaceae bacterium]